MRTWSGQRTASWFGFALLALCTGAAEAQSFPTRPITVIVPFGAGSGTDIACRIFNKGAEDDLKQTMIVDDRPGGAATVGAAYVARSAPDGYTLLCLGGGSVSKTFRKDLPIDMLTDLTPVVQITRGSMFLIVKSDLPVKTAQDFVEFIRKNPGKYNYGSIASTQMMPMEVLKDKAGLSMVHIPYKSVGNVQQGFASGDIVAYVSNEVGLEGLLAANKIRFLAVLDNERNPYKPDIPAAPEVGLAGVLAPFTQAYWAPANTPPEAINRLNAAFNASLKTQATLDYLRNQGARPTGGPPKVQYDSVKAEQAYWAEAARIAKYEPE
jgi:tripartite-type tricarboxylate transporter receptor subunit TctC